MAKETFTSKSCNVNDFGYVASDFGDIAPFSITTSPNFGDNVPELSEINDFGYVVTEVQDTKEPMPILEQSVYIVTVYFCACTCTVYNIGLNYVQSKLVKQSHGLSTYSQSLK